MLVVLVVMVACAAAGWVVAASLAAYAQRHWKRPYPPDGPPGGDTRDRYDLAG